MSSRRIHDTKAATVRLGVAAVVAGFAFGASVGALDTQGTSAKPPAREQAVAGDNCDEFMCGTNHNQVLL